VSAARGIRTRRICGDGPDAPALPKKENELRERENKSVENWEPAHPKTGGKVKDQMNAPTEPTTHVRPGRRHKIKSKIP